MRKALSAFSYFPFLLLCVEVFLRLQQVIHPLVDLEFEKYDERNISYDLNHKPGIQEDYNSDGIQFNRNRPAEFSHAPKALKVLFMGDSFMQGYPPAQTIPQYVWEEFQKTDYKSQPLLFWNAGYSSYAPLLYIIQAKKIIPKYQPDYVVIDIDESDMVDDFALYHPFLTRDSEGRAETVRPSPPYETRIKGFVSLSHLSLYTARLLGMWIHKIRIYFMYKDYNQKQKAKYYRDSLSDKNGKFSFNLVPSFSQAEEADEIYLPERESFLKDLRELASTLVDLTGDPRKILILYHPHLYHLTPDPRGFLWRQYVPPMLKQVSEEFKIEFYDSTMDLKREFGDRPDKFYREWDMHFYPNGLEVYSRLITQHLSEKFKRQPVFK